MSETGEAIAINQLEALMGPESKSFIVDGTLAHLRGENKKRGPDFTPTRIQYVDDILMYLRAVRDDTPADDKNNIDKMSNAVVTLTDYNLDAETAPALNPLRKHILEQKKKWEKEVKDATGEDLDTAQDNLKIFNSFSDFLDSPTENVDSVPKGTTTAETEARDEIEEQEQFPEFAFNPYDSDEFLAKLPHRKINFKTLQEYLTKARKDIYVQRNKVKEEHKELYSAYTAAKKFSEERPENTEHIVIIVANNSVAYAGSAQNAPHNADGQKFLFTNNTSDDGPNSLGHYREVFDTYEIRAANIERGMSVVQKLGRSKNAVLGETEQDIEDQLAVTRVLDLHREYLDSADTGNLPATERKEIENKKNNLEVFSEIVNQRTPRAQKKGFSSLIDQARSKFGRKTKQDAFSQKRMELAS